jgi:hypothetical protein
MAHGAPEAGVRLMSVLRVLDEIREITKDTK